MNKKIRIFLIAIVLLFLTVCPSFIDGYMLTVLTSIMMTTLLAQSWNLLSGYAGQFSFGQAAFFGIGAYTSVVLYTAFGVSPWAGLLIGMLAAALFGAAIGYLSFHCKIKGDYFALATLAFAEILRLLVYNSSGTVFGGPSGIFVKFIKGGDAKAFQFESWKPYYYIIFILVIGVTVMLSLLSKTRYGLQLISVREDECAADSLGVNVLRYKLSAIAFSAAIAAAAGVFYSQYYLFIDPSSVFGSSISMQAIIPCIIGGAGTPLGPILGSFLIVPVQELTNSLFTDISGINMIVYGLLIVVFILFCPNGIVGIYKKIKRKAEKK